MEYIHYGRQCIEDDDIAAVTEALKSGYLTTGPYVADFERILAENTGSDYAVAVANGTAALHIAALVLNLQKGDEVITSPITFAASANCVLYCGARPVFADIDHETMLLDIDKVKEKINANTKAIIPVHYGGELCDMDAYTKLADEYDLTIIQDSAHSLGGLIHGKHQGAYPGMQIWSFHPVKTITTGEGGAVTTNDKNFFNRLMKLRTHGITRDAKQFVKEDGENDSWYYEMQELGFNYRLTDPQCALGISQLKKLHQFVLRRKEIVERYNKAFKDLPVVVQRTPEWSDPVRHLYTIRIRDKSRRREVFDKLKDKNIGVNAHYIPVYLLPYYQSLGYKRGLCPIAEDAFDRLITLPLHQRLSDGQVEYVIKAVSDVIS